MDSNAIRINKCTSNLSETMQMVLGELFYTIAPVYIDDIIVHSRTFEEHLEDVGQVFERIQEANLKLGPEKCKFCFEEIKFLGHILGKDGIRTDPAKIEKVKNYPRPMLGVKIYRIT